MRSVIRLRRRVVAGAIGPDRNQIDLAEPVYTDPSTNHDGLGPGNRPVDFLSIGHGGLIDPTILVGATRQLELKGIQTVEVGATNAKTFDVTNFRLTGGGQANADLLSTDGLGNLGWVDLNDLGGLTGIIVSAPLAPTTGTNVGTTTNPLTLTMADAAQITAGVNTVFPISSAGLRSVTGDLTTLTTGASARGSLVAAINDVVTTIGNLDIGVTTNASLEGDGTSVAGQALRISPATALEISATTPDNIKAVSPAGLRGVTGALTDLDTSPSATTLVAAINEVMGHVATLQSGVTPIGTYDTSQPANLRVRPFDGSPFGPAPGPLPISGPNNKGWYVIVSPNAGPGVAPAPTATLAIGDQLLSSGTAWDHIVMSAATTPASSVVIDAITGMTGATTVQEALESLQGNKLSQVYLDSDQFSGNGLTAATPIQIVELDGGVYV